MTDGHEGAYADPIVLPFSITIPDPRPAVNGGMSRLRPIVNHPARGWPGDRPSNYWSLDDILGFAAELFGAPSARAQEGPPGEEDEEGSRRGSGERALEPAEELRLFQYGNAMRRLRALEPDNPELSTLTGPDYVPTEAVVREVQQELAAAEARAKRASDLLTGRREPDIAHIVASGGVPVGYRLRVFGSRARSFVRTVPPEEFNEIKRKLLQLPWRLVNDPSYKGTWYELNDDTAFGFRTNKQGIATIDVRSSQLDDGFRIREK